MRRSIFLAFFLALLLLGSRTLANEGPPIPPVEPVDDLASAKELHRKGLVRLDAGDYAGALSFFESSRALVRSHANTRNVALCLDALGRKQEALAMFETLLHDYPDKLDPDERTVTEKRIAELRAELAPPPQMPIPKMTPPPAKKGPGPWSVGVFLGYAGGPSLGSDAESYVAKNCTTNCPGAHGIMTGARIGYRLSRFFTLEVSGGYVRLDSTFAQTWKATSYTYALEVERVLSGGFVEFGASARWPLGSRLGFVSRLGFGALFSDVANTTSGVVIGHAHSEAKLTIAGDRAEIANTSLLVFPEVGFDVMLGRFVLGGGFGAVVSDSTGPTFGPLRLKTERTACTDPNAGACAPDLTVSTGVRSLGTFVVFVPSVFARYQFE